MIGGINAKINCDCVCVLFIKGVVSPQVFFFTWYHGRRLCSSGSLVPPVASFSISFYSTVKLCRPNTQSKLTQPFAGFAGHFKIIRTFKKIHYRYIRQIKMSAIFASEFIIKVYIKVEQFNHYLSCNSRSI